MTALDRPYGALAEVYLAAGEVTQAAALVDAWEEVPANLRRGGETDRLRIRGKIAAADGRLDEAIRDLRRSLEVPEACPWCALPDLADAFEQMAQPDSAIAALERYLNEPGTFRLGVDARVLAATYRRLGELYEAQGHPGRAVEYYDEFVQHWQEADPALQPLVTDVRARIARLVGE